MGVSDGAQVNCNSHPMHKPAPIRDDDGERLEVLRSLNLLDTEGDEAFDRITHAASATLKVWSPPCFFP